MKNQVVLFCLFFSVSCVSVGPQNLDEEAKKYVVTSKAFYDSDAEWEKVDESLLTKDIGCAPILLSAHHIREKIYGNSLKVAYGPYIFERTDVGNRAGKLHVFYSNGQLLCSLELKSSTQFWYYSKSQSLLAFHEENERAQVTKFDLTDSCEAQYSVFFAGQSWADTIQKWRDLNACKE